MAETLIIFIATKLHGFIALLAAYLFVVASKQQQKELLVLSAIALPLSFFTSRLLGLIIVNPRPFVVSDIQPLFAHVANNGFPSDHTLLVATIASIVFVHNKSWGFILFAMSVLVGLGRVLSGVHHTVDILASFGVAVVAIATTQYSISYFRSVKIKRTLLKI